MSRHGSFAGVFPTAPSVHNQKRKLSTLERHKPEFATDIAPPQSLPETSSLHDGCHKRRRISNNENIATSTDAAEQYHLNSDAIDPLNGNVGSVSSASTTSSIFSHHGQGGMAGLNGASTRSYDHTPLTVNDGSPPGPPYSPKPATSPDQSLVNGLAAPRNGEQPLSPLASSFQSTTQLRPRVRPGAGEVKGQKIVYDPETDPKSRKLPRDQRPKLAARWRPFGQAESSIAPPDPRLAIPGYRDGDLGEHRGQAKVWKQRLRERPYTIPPYSWDETISVGSGPPTAIVVTGFDPFTAEAQLRAIFSGFGEITAIDNKTDPNTGSFLGICWIKYRDGSATRGGRLAADAAKKAEKDGNGMRVGLNSVTVERDRIGKKSQHYVERASRKAAEKRQKERELEEAQRVPRSSHYQTLTPHDVGDQSPAPPPNAPRGPSGKSIAVRPPDGPRAATVKASAQQLIELEPILGMIKRKPYLFIPDKFVPVMGTTIPHLKKRMKAFDWREVRCDKSGYFVVFDDSKRGEDEAVRCFKDMNGKPMFTYKLEMECQQYGNPNYERSPSPERAAAIKRKQEEEERTANDAAEDWEAEKKIRAENLDVAAASEELLWIELMAKVMDDIKTKLAAPALFDFLDPSRHAAKRQERGLADPPERPTNPSLFIASDVGAQGRGSSRPHDNRRQALHGRVHKTNTNAFVDERRQKATKRRPAPTSLHHRLLALHGEDSDDEEKASSREDLKGDDSRSISRLSSVAPDAEPLSKSRRRVPLDNEESIKGDESGEDDLGPARKFLDPHLLRKEPEDMAVAELQQVLSTVPWKSSLYKHAQREFKIRQRNRDDDKLFSGLKTEDVASSVEISVEDAGLVVSDDMMVGLLPTKKKKETKTKKKSKKQLFEEREAAKIAAKSAKSLLQDEPVPSPEPAQTEDEATKDEDGEDEQEAEAEEEERAEVEWGVSTDVPRRTVEDEPTLVMDIDGWQHIVKDDEDFLFLRAALDSVPAAGLGSAHTWAHGQKEIKRLNVDGDDLNGQAAAISGYYVSNQSGAARTEGIKKILESEKSKYLPHRLKVAAARAQRQAERSNPTSINAEAAKKAKLASTAMSRSSRATNRTHMKDINTVKQSLISDGQHGDAIRFNALKKRKKLVKFERSAIHGWGLYADENIQMGDMIIEYVGEKVRQAVANIREIRYDKQGMGSSYLFRIDDDSVVDATKKGGIARFINHSCAPNCTAKIIKVDGTKRIVIYGLKDIAKDEELTYDYKFDRELDNNDRIPCLCGSEVCKGFLN